MKLRNTVFLLSFLSLIGQNIGIAATSAQQVQESARQFLAGNLPAATAGSEREIQISAPDPRLQLSDCPQAPEGFWPNNARQSGTTVVGVRCPATNGWQVFVPVQIQEWNTVIVASRPLRPGERLQPADMKPMKISRAQLRGNTVTDAASLIGAVTRQAIAAGQPLTDRLTCQICRGDEVSIAAGTPGFEVVVKGIAEGFGNTGDRVPVRNLSSRRTIQAVVVGNGHVRVLLE